MAQWIDNLNAGDSIESNNFGTMEVIYVAGSRDVGVKFVSTGTIVNNLQKGNVLRGCVSDYMVRTVQGVGYIGSDIKAVSCEAYDPWHSMLERCYSEAYHKTRPQASDCTVCEPWQNFTVFKEWYDKNSVKGFHLDKDLLVQGNRVYSEETCCFLPQEINSLISGNISKGDCPLGVSKRRKKGSTEYNGLLTVSACGAYLGRFLDAGEGYSHYKEFKELLYQTYAEDYLERGIIGVREAKALSSRRSA